MGAINVQLTRADRREIETDSSKITVHGGRMSKKYMQEVEQCDPSFRTVVDVLVPVYSKTKYRPNHTEPSSVHCILSVDAPSNVGPAKALYNYSRVLPGLLKSLGADPRKFDVQSLRRFVLERSQRCGWAAAKKCTTAVRMFQALSDGNSN